jgi:hypothetical protein
VAPRRRSAAEQQANYGRLYRRARAALLASRPLCALRLPGCTAISTQADHVPPIAEHRHLGDGAGCCRLRPVCASCNMRSGGWRLANRRRRADLTRKSAVLQSRAR